MTLREARRILGLGPDEDPRPLLPGLRVARESLAALVRDAPNDDLALRHQDALVAFDRALATVRETLEVLGLQEAASVESVNEQPDIEEEEADEPRSSGWKFAAVMFVLLLVATCGGGVALLEIPGPPDDALRAENRGTRRRGHHPSRKPPVGRSARDV